MRISVITVCYNSSKTIRDTLESVLGQNYAEIEYIIVDGASSDGTVNIIKEFESKFQGRLKWVSEPDYGIYDAMNKGIKMSTGDIIGFLNADDYYQDSKVVNDIAAIFNESHQIDAVHGNLSYINSAYKVVRVWQGSSYYPGAFQKGWSPAHPTLYCKKQCFEEWGMFDSDIGSAADFELMLRFIEKGKINTRFIDRNIVYMRTGGSSTNGIKAVLRNTNENLQAFRLNKIHCPWYYPISRLMGKIFSLKKPLHYFMQH